MKTKKKYKKVEKAFLFSIRKTSREGWKHTSRPKRWRLLQAVSHEGPKRGRITLRDVQDIEQDFLKHFHVIWDNNSNWSEEDLRKNSIPDIPRVLPNGKVSP